MTPLRRDRPGPFIGRARHHNSVVALQPDLLVGLMTPLRRDRPGPLIGRARHPLRTRRRMQASNKPKNFKKSTLIASEKIYIHIHTHLHIHTQTLNRNLSSYFPDAISVGFLSSNFCAGWKRFNYRAASGRLRTGFRPAAYGSIF